MPPPPPAPEPDDDPPTEVTAPGPAESGAVIPGQRSETRRGAPDDARAREAPAREPPDREPAARDTPVSDTPAPARPVGTDTDVSDESPETGPGVPRARRTPAKKAAKKAAKAAPAGSDPAKPDEPERPGAGPAAERAPDQRADASPEAGTVPPHAEAGTAGDQGAETGTARTRDAEAGTARTQGARTGTVWDRLLADPAHAPELLALAAVERLGPEAARYTAWIRATYPGATDDRLAQAAGRRFAASARHGALAGSMLTGSVLTGAAVPGVVRAAVLGWQQARLVLHVAAAYGQDPCAPERAAELLVLLRVHGDLPGARDALATARQTGVPRPAGPVLPAGLLSAGLLGAGRRLFTRLVPGAGVLVDVLVNDAVMEGLARRAIGLYRSGKLRAPATVSAAGARQGGTAGVTRD